ncbi:hypothetical protein P3W33_16385 [Luteibacter sp. PPL552]
MATAASMCRPHASEARRPEAGSRAVGVSDGRPKGARRRRRLDAKHDSAPGLAPAGDARHQVSPYYLGRQERTAIRNDDPLEHILQRSNALQEQLDALLRGAAFDSSPRGEAALSMCLVAMEHATALRALVALGLPTSAVSLMRMQFEALTRAMWLLYAAGDAAIDKLLAPLTPGSEQAAKNLPGASEMIEQIGKRVGQDAPPAAHQMLSHFKDVTWHAMNSFVHGGIHPLRRSADGFPVDLVVQVLRSSNGLTTMTGMTMAILTGSEAVTKPMSKIQPVFADCLPDLLKP